MDNRQIAVLRIQAEKAKGRSWRDIKKDYRGKFSPAVLLRVATSDYWPKDERIVESLTHPRQPKPRKSRIPRYGWMLDVHPRTLTKMLEKREAMR